MYRVFAPESDRPLALKVLAVSLGNPAHARAAQRAWRELDLLSELHLPCLPRVINSGIHDGSPFIVTEWIEGATLDEYCATRLDSREMRVRLLATVARCVHTVHERGVIHRDIKPSNILIDSHGSPMIVDFGLASMIARKWDSRITMTEVGVPLGTPAFMSPEQARGERVQQPASVVTEAESNQVTTAPIDFTGVSTRSDVYSLGATAYFVLTGHTPHDMNGSQHDVIQRVSQQTARDPRTLDQSVPKQLAAVLMKACATLPGDRYESARSLADDLERWADGKPVLATNPGVLLRVLRWLPEHPNQVRAAVASLAMLVLGIAGAFASAWWLGRTPTKLTADLGTARLVARSGRVLHEWGDTRTKPVVFGQLVDRPDSLGGGQVALVGYGLQSQTSSLCAYDARHPDTLLWSTPFGGDGFAARVLPGSSPREPWMMFQGAIVADVFSESPGDEIVAIHLNWQGDGACIRVYDLAGTVLYEAWHPGHLYGAYWFSSAKQLALVGVNSEAYWSDRGGGGGYHWPVVVLAIKPEMGERRGWISTTSLKGDVQPIWYRCVLPSGAIDERGKLLPGSPGVPTGGYGDPASTMVVTFGNSTWLIVDSDGQVVQRVVMSDQKGKPALASGERPLIEQVYLGDLPPISTPENETPSPHN